MPDMIAVFGGGSAIDAVKIACVAVTRDAQDYDGLLGVRATLDAAGKLVALQTQKPCTVVAIPTTLSAAEFGIIAGATDTKTGIKHAFQSDNLAPDFILYDPWLAAATPQDLWLSTGMRAVDHAIETVLSIDSGPLTDALALQGLTMLAEGLNAAHSAPGNANALHTCQMGAWLSGTSIGRVRYGASHGLGHQLGAVALQERDFAGARVWYLKSLEIKEKQGNLHYAATTYGQLGNLAALEGSFEESGAWFIRAISTFRQTNDEHLAQRNIRNFQITHKHAPGEDQQKLEAQWRDAGLGEFPTSPLE